jgi:hypothetical protein
MLVVAGTTWLVQQQQRRRQQQRWRRKQVCCWVLRAAADRRGGEQTLRQTAGGWLGCQCDLRVLLLLPLPWQQLMWAGETSCRHFLEEWPTKRMKEH